MGLGIFNYHMSSGSSLCSTLPHFHLQISFFSYQLWKRSHHYLRAPVLLACLQVFGFCVSLSNVSARASLSHDWMAIMVSERNGMDIAELVVYIFPSTLILLGRGPSRFLQIGRLCIDSISVSSATSASQALRLAF